MSELALGPVWAALRGGSQPQGLEENLAGIRAGLLEETAEGIEGEPVSPDRVGEAHWPRRRDKQGVSSAHWVGPSVSGLR